jgi:hypothetical protein
MTPRTSLARLAPALLALASLGGCAGRAEPADAPAAGATATSVRDLAGRALDPLAARDARAVVLLFADPQCPISNAFAPEVARLHAEFAPRGVAFWLVYADRSRTPDEVRAHVESFAYPMPALLDPAHELMRRTGARVTPEACVLAPDGVLAYRGRIDDRFVDFGKLRAAPTSRDLRAALEAVLAGELPPEPWPAAIGCAIPE